MPTIQRLNRALLGTLMSKETANIVADRLEELERENTKLREEIAIRDRHWSDDKARLDFLKEHTHLEFHVHHPDYAQTANGGHTFSAEGVVVRELIDNARQWLAKKSPAPV